MKKKIINAYKEKKVLRIEWGVAIAISLVMLIAFTYIDLKSLTIWSTDLLDVIVEGRIYDFYEYGAENIYGAPHQYIGCNLFVFIPWAIWNIPIWILQRFAGMKIIDNPLMMLWSKMFLIIVLLLTMYFTYRIVMMIAREKEWAQWIVALALTYPFTYIGVYYSGQSDIISVCFFTIAIYFLLKKDQRLFIICSSCAIAAKPFYLLCYIAIVLLLEKNIGKIFIKLFLGYGITLVLNLLYSNAPMYQKSMEMGPMNKMLELILGNGYDTMLTEGSYLVFVLVLLYFYAYMKRVNEDEYDKYVIFMAVVPMMLHFMFAGFEHYRMILLTPFLFILFAQNKKYFRINMIVNVIVTFCALMCIINYSTNIFSTQFMEETLFVRIFGETDIANRIYVNLHDIILNKIPNFSIYAKAFAGAFGAGNLILIGINHPRFNKEFRVETENCERWIVWGHMLMLVPFIILLILCYYKVR